MKKANLLNYRRLFKQMTSMTYFLYFELEMFVFFLSMVSNITDTHHTPYKLVLEVEFV